MVKNMKMNNTMIIGRLTRDPEAVQTNGGTAVARFTVAVDRNGKDAGTDFIPATAFGKTAEYMIAYLKTGALVSVEGRIQVQPYTDKNGNKRTDIRVIAHRVQSMRTGGNGETVAAAPAVETAAADMVVADDDLPF